MKAWTTINDISLTLMFYGLGWHSHDKFKNSGNKIVDVSSNDYSIQIEYKVTL